MIRERLLRWKCSDRNLADADADDNNADVETNTEIDFDASDDDNISCMKTAQVEMLRSQLGEHEQSCAFRLVNCVDLACQQRIPVSRYKIMTMMTMMTTTTTITKIQVVGPFGQRP